MFTLEEIHLEAAKQIALNHRKKKSCGHCYDRGWVGVNDENLLILCTKCVDMDEAMEAWKTYVSGHEELKEHFSELFEESTEEETEKEFQQPSAHEMLKATPKKAREVFVPGQKRTGLKKV